MKKYICILLLLCSVNISFAQTEKHLYSTWDVIEMDTCASAWLIKTFIDKDARFKFYPQGQIINEGIAFDTPDAQLRRTAAASTFENILKKYNIKNPYLVEIGAIIHDIEINYWGQKQNKESACLNEEMITLINNSSTAQECLDKTFPVFNALYESLRSF